MKRLCDLMALTMLERRFKGDLFQSGYVTPAQVLLLSQASRGLLAELRPEAVALVDALLGGRVRDEFAVCHL